MKAPYEVAPDIYVLPSAVSIPGLGMVPTNAFFIQGKEPLLIDTGLGLDSDAFVAALGSLTALDDLRWIVITHDDADHCGSLNRLLELAPQARLLTHALVAVRSYANWGISLERVDPLTTGDEVRVGERRLRVVRPPLFDNPTTLGLHDQEAGVFFCVDAFGGIIPRWEREASAYAEQELANALTMWASFDSPWVRYYERAAYQELLDEVRRLGTDLLLSSHLPPARDMLERLLEVLSLLPEGPPFIPPNREVFAQLAGGVEIIGQSVQEGEPMDQE